MAWQGVMTTATRGLIVVGGSIQVGLQSSPVIQSGRVTTGARAPILSCRLARQADSMAATTGAIVAGVRTR